MMRALISVAIMAVVLSSCTQRQGPPRKVIDRALKTAPGKAQPSRIVATELAFARAGRDKGQSAAFRQFTAPGAVILGPDGIVDASKWLSGSKQSGGVTQSGVRTVWMSCDARMAISKGRYREPSGIVGSYITVWERYGRDGDAEYRWVFNTAAVDDPQPTPKKADDGEGTIIVIADEMIRGHVADCPKRGARGELLGARGPEPRDGMKPISEATVQKLSLVANGQKSPDGTIVWGWQESGDAAARFESYFLNDGQWRKAASFPSASRP